MKNLAMLQMMQISDSLFPIGAFTLSNGLETYVCENKLSTIEDLEQYLNSYLAVLPYNDLGAMMLAYVHADDRRYLKELDVLSMALKSPMEVRTGSRKLCSRFLKLWEKIHAYESLQEYYQLVKEHQCQGNHAIAVGLYTKEIGLTIEQGAAIYVYSLLTAIVTNAVKTIPLSQTMGQKLLNQFLQRIDGCVEKAADVTMEDLGIGGTEFDIAAMKHETLYSRLYMS